MSGHRFAGRALIASMLAAGCSDEAVQAHARRQAEPAVPASAPGPLRASTPAAVLHGAAVPSVAAPVAAASAAPVRVAASSPTQPTQTDRPPIGPLRIPVLGIDASMLRDTFAERRGTQPHEALDIAAPRGTPVVAVAPGRVVKLFTSVPGGLTVYQFDASERYAYYYAHLDRYADGLKEGQWLDGGAAVGTVGSTGNASPDAPHLHFAIFELGPGREWWKGTPVNPYPLLLGGPR
jgi:peptidoglycan LD-endopeptidase LytH